MNANYSLGRLHVNKWVHLDVKIDNLVVQQKFDAGNFVSTTKVLFIDMETSHDGTDISGRS